jgi:hypothetical protein
MSTNFSSTSRVRRSAITPRRPPRSMSRRSLIAIAAVAVGLSAVHSSIASAASTSITDRLSTSKTAVEVASLPTGTQLVKVAVMKNLSGEGVTYKLISATQTSFTPPAGYPVVDMQASTSTGSPIGIWAGRLQTSTATSEESKAEREARELKEREAKEKAEREAREKAEREAKEKAEREAKERVEREAMEKAEREAREKAEREALEEPAHSPMWVGVDAGGWNWASALKDVSGAVKYLRSSYTNYNTDTNVQRLSEDHLTLLPLFGTGGSIGGINATEYAKTVVTWFKRYGHGGTFWAGKTDYGAKTTELLNEPGGSWFWSDPTNYAAYAALAKTVHAALEANFAPAVRPTLLCSYDGGAGSTSWGRALFKAAPEVAKNCDALDVHPYGGHGSTSAQGRRASITEAHSDTGKPVYVTEVGWPTAVGREPTGDSLQWTEEQQAANVRSFVVWARSLGYVNAVINFNYADYGTNAFYGVVKSNGTTHKLSYATMQSLTAEG